MHNPDGRLSLRTPLVSGRNSIFGRQSLFGANGRPSLRASDVQGLPRLSYGAPRQRASSAARIPPRNVRDKTYLEMQKAKVREFLRANSSIDPNCLNAPNSSQFNAIFTCVYVFFDPDFQLKDAKDQVPKILNGLGYPTAIKPSMMQTVYAAHSWAHLVDGLAFMIELQEKFERTNIFDEIFGDVGDVKNNRLCAYAYSTRAFQKYNRTQCDPANGSNFAEERESFRALVHKNYEITDGETQADKELKAANEHLEELRNGSKKAMRIALEQNVESIKADVAALKPYNLQMEGFVSTLNQKEFAIIEHETQLTAQIEALRIEIEKKKTTIRTQPISAQEVRERTQCLQNLRNELKHARNELHEIREDPTNNQGAIYKLFSGIKTDFARIGIEISTVAEDYFSNEEQRRLGFTKLGDERNMNPTMARSCLEEFRVALKHLTTRMEGAADKLKTQTMQNKALASEIDRRLDRGCLERTKIKTEVGQVRRNLEQTLNDRKQELARVELNQNVVLERYKAAENKKKNFEAKLYQIEKRISDAQVEQMKHSQDFEEKLNIETERIVGNVSEIIAKQQAIQDKVAKKSDELEMVIAAHYRRFGIEKPPVM